LIWYENRFEAEEEIVSIGVHLLAIYRSSWFFPFLKKCEAFLFEY